MPVIVVAEDRTATLDGLAVGRVRPQSVKLLAALAAARGRRVPKGDLLDWMQSESANENLVNMNVSYLRRLFGVQVVTSTARSGVALGPGYAVTIHRPDVALVAIPQHLQSRVEKAAKREGVEIADLVEIALEEFL